MATVTLHPNIEPDDDPTDLPLVLLSPFPIDARAWRGVADLLDGDVIRVDPPGFGGDQGGQVDDDPSITGYAQAVLAALDERGVDRFVVAGNSMGGYAAMALAELAPERIAGIGLFGTKSTADTDEARQGRLAMADAADAGTPVEELLAAMPGNLLGETTRQDAPQIAEPMTSCILSAPAQGVVWAQRAMAGRPDRTEVLRALAARGIPAVVARGVEDGLMDAASQQVMADALGVTALEIPRCGHLVPFESPGACATLVRDLWERAQA